MVPFFRKLTVVSTMVWMLVVAGLSGVAILSVAHADETVVGTDAQSAGAQVGTMIDASMTAEGALPDFHGDQSAKLGTKEIRVDAAEQADMDSAVKMALAKTATVKSGDAEAGEVRTDGGIPVVDSGTASIGSINAALNAQAAAGKTGGLNNVANSNDESKQLIFSESPVKTKKAPAESVWWRMWGSLAIVFVLMAGGYYGFKKWPGSKKLTSRNRMIEVLSQHHLGPKRSIAVVRVAGEACLIGITDSNISILKTLSLLDDDVPAAKEMKSDGSADSNPLAARFQNALAAKFTKSPEAEKAASAATATKATGNPSQKPAAANDQFAFYTRTAKKSESNEDDFSMQGLREIVGEKLKTMREL